MAENDEPFDDPRAVGLTTSVAAVRVVETIAKDAHQRVQQQREAVAAPWQAARQRPLWQSYSGLPRARQTGLR